jgi:RNA polymerase sigma-70 factor (ECF subfamily)
MRRDAVLETDEQGIGASEPAGAGGLEAVYLTHRQQLARFLRARGAGDQAEDLVQELWVNIRARSSAPIADPRAYLFRAANNLMISRHRSHQRASRLQEDWANATGDTERPPDEGVAARDEIACAERRLRALGLRVLRTFILFRLHGLPQRDIADRLGISLSTVEKDLQRAYKAIAALKDELDADLPDGGRL